MALGAKPGQAAATIALPVAALVLLGLGAGAGLAGAGNRILEGLLYGVKPLDPVSWAGAAALLVTGASAGLLPPVVRVLRLNPAAVLRDE
jgi:ABC-type antimicrobial peptide transport system permease subunit